MPTLTGFQFVLVGFAAIAAGAVNALAGGGTLITFPMLTAVGLPAIMANVTNTAGQVSYTDPGATNQPRRFYKAIQMP